MAPTTLLPQALEDYADGKGDTDAHGALAAALRALQTESCNAAMLCTLMAVLAVFLGAREIEAASKSSCAAVHAVVAACVLAIMALYTWNGVRYHDLARDTASVRQRVWQQRAREHDTR